MPNRRNNSRKGSIYVVGFGDYVKIGFTSRPLAHRLQALQTSTPEKLIIYSEVKGSTAVEASLHKHFAAHRTHGEWFRREPPIDQWIKDGCP